MVCYIFIFFSNTKPLVMLCLIVIFSISFMIIHKHVGICKVKSKAGGGGGERCHFVKNAFKVTGLYSEML